MTATGGGVIVLNAGNMFKRAEPLLPSFFARVQTPLVFPRIGDAVGTLPARADERDGSKARSSLLTHGVSEAAKTHPSAVSQRERLGLCLHGKIALVSFRV